MSVKNACIKCESMMVEAKLDSYPIRVYKSTEKANWKTMSDCGFIELYALNPEKLESKQAGIKIFHLGFLHNNYNWASREVFLFFYCAWSQVRQLIIRALGVRSINCFLVPAKGFWNDLKPLNNSIFFHFNHKVTFSAEMHLFDVP